MECNKTNCKQVHNADHNDPEHCQLNTGLQPGVKKVDVFDWTSQSPDLNPTDYALHLLKIKLKREIPPQKSNNRKRLQKESKSKEETNNLVMSGLIQLLQRRDLFLFHYCSKWLCRSIFSFFLLRENFSLWFSEGITQWHLWFKSWPVDRTVSLTVS